MRIHVLVKLLGDSVFVMGCFATNDHAEKVCMEDLWDHDAGCGYDGPQDWDAMMEWVENAGDIGCHGYQIQEVELTPA